MWNSHNFFGPGKSDYSKEPIDADDGIAREHDLLYESARSFDDIHNADAKAIKQFGSDFFKTGNWHSLLGATGLGIKYSVEGITNRIIYPNLQEKSVRTEESLTKGTLNTPIVFPPVNGGSSDRKQKKKKT